MGDTSGKVASRWRSWTASAVARLLPAALLVALVAATFGGVLEHGFLAWDDEQNIAANPHLNPPTLEGVARFWSAPFKGLYVPLSYTFLALEARLDEALRDPARGVALDPAVFHAGNLLLHAACVLMVYALLQRWSGSRGAAALGAALFAVHPVQVESVAWVFEVRGLLGSLFALLALWFHGSFVAGGPRKAASYAAGTACLVLALLSKPSAAATPLIAWILAVSLQRAKPAWTALTLLPWMGLAVAAGLWTRMLQPDSGVQPAAALWTRPLIAGDALCFYLGKLLLPDDLAADYGRSPERVLASPWSWVAWTLPAGLLVATVLLRKGRWSALAGYGVFIAGVAPVLGLVPFHYQTYSTVADRYLHLAMLGPAIVAAFALVRAWSPVVVGAAAAVVLVLAGLSRAQTAHWRNDLTLFSHSLSIQPESYPANVNLGLYQLRRGSLGEAIAHLKRATELKPGDARAPINLATAYERSGEPDEALAWYRRSLELQPEFAPAHCNLGTFLLRQGRRDEAMQCFQQAVVLDPGLSEALNNIALIHLQEGRLDEAIGVLQAVLERSPRLAEAHYNLGRALAGKGRREEALAHLREAVRLAPSEPEPRRALRELQRQP